MSLTWIGDFRSRALQAFTTKDDYYFLIEDSASCGWLKNTASTQLSKILSETGSVVIALGFNDCVNSSIWDYFNIETIANDYIAAINKLVEQHNNANFYVCSINPINADLPTAQVEAGVIKKKLLNDKIKQFNKLIKDNCAAMYVDLYTYLADTQFSTIDGVRYSKETCINILNYIDCYNSTGVAGFVPRTSAPVVTAEGMDTSGAYWLGDSYGGLNPFDDLGQSYAKCKGDTLPNCTAYAWGRFYEIIGSRPTLSTSNAEDWYGYTSDGYERGQTPRLGAVACWSKGKVGYQYDDGAGHVAIVEQINQDGSILISESGWNCSWYFKTETIYKNESGEYRYGAAYDFQGFIYCPAVKNDSITGYVSKSQVTSGNFWIDHKSEEMQLNARYIWQYLGNKGWTLNAVAGMLGNLQAESRINPGIWQGLNTGVGPAFGLAQWDPFTKYTKWCEANGYDKSDMDTALKRIEAEVEASTVPGWSSMDQWITTSRYDISFKAFTTSTKDSRWLAEAFLINYERPANQSQATKDYRANNAEYWYKYLLPYAPGAAPTTTLANLKVSNITDTSAQLSCIVRGGTEITYTIVDFKDNILSETTVPIEQGKEGDIELLFYDCIKLTPNTPYKILVCMANDYETFDDEITFTTLQSFPKNVSEIELVANDNKVPVDQFLLKTTHISTSDFGYWAKNGCGYTVQLIVNGAVKSEKNIDRLSVKQNINIKDYFEYTPRIGDIIQIGIRTWTIYNGEKLFDNDFAKVSNSVCMLKKTIMPYLNTK